MRKNSLKPALHSLPRSAPFTMENILIGGIAIALLVYLVVAVIRPEKF